MFPFAKRLSSIGRFTVYTHLDLPHASEGQQCYAPRLVYLSTRPLHPGAKQLGGSLLFLDMPAETESTF